MIDVTKTIDRVADVMAQVTALTLKQVLVGVPQERAPRKGTPINNASLAYIHEFGSPAVNIPPRPFLFPGVRKAQRDIIAVMADGARRALQGERGAADDTLERVGIIARNSAVREITDPEPPFTRLKDATVRARLRRTQAGRRQLRQLKKVGTPIGTWAAANIHPLIDTGQLRASITYVVR